MKEILWEGVIWIPLSQDQDQWQAFLSTVMNFQVPKMERISQLAEKLLPLKNWLLCGELTS